MKEIELTQGKVVLVDDCDYERLNRFKWGAHKDGKTFYAKRTSPKINGKQHVIQMHHEIIGRPPRGLMTDHKDGNGLINLRNNLRYVTSRQNNQNRKNMKQSSQYPGVCWHKLRRKWIAMILINGNRKHLGCFTDEKEAFKSYKKAVESLGERML